MNKNLLIIALLAIFQIGVFAQQASLKGDVPLSYVSENEYDIDNTFEYKVWRTLSLSVKANQPLKLPVQKSKDRKNLGMVILEAITDEYDPLNVFEYSDKEMEYDVKTSGTIFNYFNIKNAYERKYAILEVPNSDNLKLVDKTDQTITFDVHKDSLVQKMSDFFDKNSIDVIFSEFSSQIYRYDIYEVWIFNKRYSTFKSEIRAISPYIYEATGGTRTPVAIGWIPFKDLRRYMVQVPIKLSDMHASKGLGQYSMDAYFTSRLYRGDIIEAENLQGKKMLDMAKSRAEVLKLREQIETDLVNLEQDIWEY